MWQAVLVVMRVCSSAWLVQLLKLVASSFESAHEGKDCSNHWQRHKRNNTCKKHQHEIVSTHQQAVDVTTQVSAVRKVLLQAAKQLQHQALLDGFMAKDGGGEGAGQQGQHVRPLSNLCVRHVRGEVKLGQMQARTRSDGCCTQGAKGVRRRMGWVVMYGGG